jgi:DHA2 family multidrug resistance protein
MMIATPIVGRIYNRVSPRLIIAVGVLFIAWGAWDMSHFTLESSQRDVTLSVMTQGIGFSCLFVPLSTVALAAIPRHKMADATGLNSLFRQVGGSIGLAVGATLLTRYGAVARAGLVSHLTPADPAAMDRLDTMVRGFVARGMDAASARLAAMRSLDGIVSQQSTLLAFDKVFLLAGVSFLAVLPLLYFLRLPEGSKGGAKGAAPPPKVEVHLE